MARKTKEDAQATRHAILEAAVRLFSSQGVTRTTLATIAREAGVTRGAIYWHFDNKAELIHALWEQVFMVYDPLLQAGESRDEPDPLGKMRALYASIFHDLTEKPRQYQLFQIFHDVEGSSKEADAIRKQHAALHQEGFRKIYTILSNAIAREQIPADVDIHLATTAITTFTHGLITSWLQDPTLFSMQKEATVLLDAFISMLRSGILKKQTS